jgi:SAM-dependent methyltransferase
MKIDDAEWFELQFNPELALTKYGIALPSLPNDEVQVGFTGLCGRQNLLQAFSFYQYIQSACGMGRVADPHILDFGGGWGRISRFFLKDTKPEHIYIAETMEYAISCLRASGNACRVVHNQPAPPIMGLTEQFDLIYAYSVFSHLSEKYFRAWIDYLLGLLRPGAYLVFTTRGRSFIDHLEHLHASTEKSHPMLEEHIRRLREEMPTPQEIRRRYENGEFQFYPIGGYAELTADFFGEAFISKSYIEEHYRPFFINFDEHVPYIDQSVVVLQKRNYALQ